MTHEVNIGNHTFNVDQDGIILSIKAPADENGLGWAIFQIGKNINEVKELKKDQ